jgi:hypothetical protein
VSVFSKTPRPVLMSTQPPIKGVPDSFLGENGIRVIIPVHLVLGLVILVIFMHGIYNYLPETNHVSSVYSVAAVLYLQFVLHVMLFRP